MVREAASSAQPKFLEGKPLKGQVALVAGATRGAGRGIARVLGQAGATVYCSGRSGGGIAATPGRPETIEETADLVTADGGKGIAARTDHTDEAQVEALVARIRDEQGQLDIVVNDIWGGDSLTEWSKKFWEIDIGVARTLLERAVLSHLITSRHTVPLMIERNQGLVVEITDGHEDGYRYQIIYDLVKASNIRLGYAMAWDLAKTGITALTVTPGFLRSEAVLDHFGVREANWRDAIAKDPFFAESETPMYVGRGIAALAVDPNKRAKAGLTLTAGDLAELYGFTDVDGRTPQFFPLYKERTAELAAGEEPLDETEQFLVSARYCQIHRNAAQYEEAGKLFARLDLANAGAGLEPVPPTALNKRDKNRGGG
ncbi:MAG: SDR family oxidoreductase [Proteobacteria bacterium]|nr:SDR family oxidoreductase [Pseudomonadota bacterium]